MALARVTGARRRRHRRSGRSGQTIADHKCQIGAAILDKKMVADRFDGLIGKKIAHGLIVEALRDRIEAEGEQSDQHDRSDAQAAVSQE